MRIKSYILGSIFTFLIIYYYTDRKYFMKKRVLSHHNWEHVSGERFRGDFIDTKNLTFRNDTMIFDYGKHGKDTLVLKWQYFSMMQVLNPKTKNVGKYTMKGANWTDYILK